MGGEGQDPVVVTPHEEGEKVYFDWQQPGWEKIVEHNLAVQRERAVEDLSFGRWELEIPTAVRYFLGKKYPDLDSKDPQIKKQAWLKFARSSASKPYRIHSRGRYLGRSVGGLDNGG